MAISNRDRIGKALDILQKGLAAFVAREFNNTYKDNALQEAFNLIGQDRLHQNKPINDWDVSLLFKLMKSSWTSVFSKIMGRTERSLIEELTEWRNKWAHQNNFSSDDTDRALDSINRLLNGIAPEQAEEISKMKMELRRLIYDEQVRNEKRKAGGSLIEAHTTGTIRPWREVITPHPDVAKGSYNNSEFAADLWMVLINQSSLEYQDPKEFFRRTYLTAALKKLLTNSVNRLSGISGDPVIQLQTNFGGGKTHSMLALYHLFSGISANELPGVDSILAEAGIQTFPKKVKRAVLVGNKISPGNPTKKDDGTIIRTLWGEIAYQLGGQKAFNRIKADDERATNPGDLFREILDECGPCLILIDEWVAYARQLHDQGDLPGGSFETQFTFAQTLTESVKISKKCLLVVSLPASHANSNDSGTLAEDIEVGGFRGRDALLRLSNIVGRVDASWQPATAEESFEIVRRRLFQPLTGDAFKARDVTIRSFIDLYHAQPSEYPHDCTKNSEYEEKMKAAYPIHPEIFDQLYNNWSTLVKFQRTRGVLRLMAAVIHCLWENDDKNPLILPATLPIDDARVQSELVHYLSDNWVPILGSNIDGPDAIPRKIDAENPHFGKYAATRRVARVIFLGSAPLANVSVKGIEDRKIRLGCVMPGENSALFGDALHRLSSKASHLYQDGNHYWFSSQPNVITLADDRAELLKRDPYKIIQELEKRVKQDIHKKRGEFSCIHDFPHSGNDIPDDMQVKLVILSAEKPYTKENGNAAETALRQLLEKRGNTPRIYQNTLVFLAADKARFQDMDEAIRKYLAWESIINEKEILDLGPHQVKQAEMQKNNADTLVLARINEVYQWLLIPTQKTPQNPYEIQAVKLIGNEPLAARASKKLCSDEALLTSLGPTRLRIELDRIPLWRGNHVPIKQLAEDFARYPYLPRLLSPSVLAASIRNGLTLSSWGKDTFAYAENYDEKENRYRGLQTGTLVDVTEHNLSGLLVKPEIALEQKEKELKEKAAEPQQAASYTASASQTIIKTDSSPQVKPAPAVKKQPKRFHGTVTLDTLRVGRDASKIAEEVIAHLAGLLGSEVSVTLEITAKVPSGAPEHVVRAVTENCRTMKFENHGFEEE